MHTTVREANDRGYEALVVSDCVGSYFPEFQRIGLEMISAQGGIFGWVADSTALLAALPPTRHHRLSLQRSFATFRSDPLEPTSPRCRHPAAPHFVTGRHP